MSYIDDRTLVQAALVPSDGMTEEMPTEEQCVSAQTRALDAYGPEFFITASSVVAAAEQVGWASEPHAAEFRSLAAQIRAATAGTTPVDDSDRLPTAAELVEHRRRNPEQWQPVALFTRGETIRHLKPTAPARPGTTSVVSRPRERRSAQSRRLASRAGAGDSSSPGEPDPPLAAALGRLLRALRGWAR